MLRRNQFWQEMLLADELSNQIATSESYVAPNVFNHFTQEVLRAPQKTELAK
jgi:hypothetical protein